MAALLDISKWVYSVLSSDDTVTDLVADRVFPIIAQQGTGTIKPTVVFRSVGFTSDRTKDGVYEDDCSLELTVLAVDVMTLQSLAEAVADALEGDETRDAVLQSYSESFLPEYQAYEGVLTFNVELL